MVAVDEAPCLGGVGVQVQVQEDFVGVKIVIGAFGTGVREETSIGGGMVLDQFHHCPDAGLLLLGDILVIIPIKISPKLIQSIMPPGHTIRVEHGHYFNYEVFQEGLGLWVFWVLEKV